MAYSFELIASSTVGSGGAANIEFTSIPATYTDLCIKLSTRCGFTGGVANLSMQINGNTGANYQYRELIGNGSTASSGSGTNSANFNSIQVPNDATSNTFNNVEIYIPNYAGSTQKSISVDAVTENNSASTNVQARFQAWLWLQTSAINQLTFTSQGSTNFLQYSTAYLYGISNS
jgi:hypothetical protein